MDVINYRQYLIILVVPGSSAESYSLSSPLVSPGEGDSGDSRWQGGAAGGHGDAGAGAGQHEPGDQQGQQHHQVVAEDQHDQHPEQENRQPDRPARNHDLGGQEGETTLALKL